MRETRTEGKFNKCAKEREGQSGREWMDGRDTAFSIAVVELVCDFATEFGHG